MKEYDVQRLPSATAYERITEELIRSGEYEKLGYRVVDCPICGHRTLDMYWICPRCRWEYDGTAEEQHSSANGNTPRDYRKAYESNSDQPTDRLAQ